MLLPPLTVLHSWFLPAAFGEGEYMYSRLGVFHTLLLGSRSHHCVHGAGGEEMKKPCRMAILENVCSREP